MKHVKNSRVPGRKVSGLHEWIEDYSSESCAFTHYRMDEGRILNRLGHTLLFLKKLGINSVDDVFMANVPTWRYYIKAKKSP